MAQQNQPNQKPQTGRSSSTDVNSTSQASQKDFSATQKGSQDSKWSDSDLKDQKGSTSKTTDASTSRQAPSSNSTRK